MEHAGVERAGAEHAGVERAPSPAAFNSSVHSDRPHKRERAA
jgi:hypothetical protein